MSNNMQASDMIFALWDDAQLGNIAQTFANVYGEQTGYTRFNETIDARDRHDAVRIVKSMQQLWEDAPDLPVIHTWPMWGNVCEIAEHIFDEDYPSAKRVSMAARNPCTNQYGYIQHKDGNPNNNVPDNLVLVEAIPVAPDDDIQEDGEDAPDVTLDDLKGDDDDEQA